jgi:diguanylate cyclase (GGDEF)-like protein
MLTHDGFQCGAWEGGAAMNVITSKMHALQSEILEAIALGQSFETVADLLCRRVEELAPAAICSILRITDGRLKPVAAPRLPQHYSNALDGIEIGPSVGSCGTSAYRGEPVEVTDIATDPSWAPYRGLALPLGLKACWSSPIKAGDGRVVATFAFYYRKKRGPTALDRRIVDACVHLCAIAIEHDEAQKRNFELAYFDQLTNLPNRRSFDEMIRGRLQEKAPRFGLILVDIDNLKIVNDTMGHVVGDALICEVAKRFKAVDPPPSACRLGGDEFAVFADGCDDPAALRARADELGAVMKEPFACNGNMVVPQVTMGGVLYGNDGILASDLRQNADFALYHAKETNRGGYVRFEPGLRTSIGRRAAAIKELDRALNDNRIFAYYQPIFHMEANKITGLEALARMRTADGQIVTAGEFRAAFSDSNVACRTTDRIIAQVARDLRCWLDAGIFVPHVGVNLSTADFQRDDLERRLSEHFDRAGVPLRHLLLEVTETVLMGDPNDNAVRAIERLRKRGMVVALDDFGTGYASLTHLLTFPVDIIKIDKSFIDRLLSDRDSQFIVEALIDLSRKLGLRIVAEGIETEMQAARLRALGSDAGQGYYFSRPIDFASVTELLRGQGQTSAALAEIAAKQRRA